MELIGAKSEVGTWNFPEEKSGQWRSLSLLVTV